jgi:hypothetical protein
MRSASGIASLGVVRVRCGARGLPRAARAEDRVAADQQGLGGGKHEGRDLRPAGHGGLVQAVGAVVMTGVWQLSCVQVFMTLSLSNGQPHFRQPPAFAALLRMGILTNKMDML